MFKDRKIGAIILTFLSFVWAFTLFVDYIDKHPIYYASLQHFKYFDLLLVLQLLGLAAFGLIHFLNWRRLKRYFYTGISFILIFIICSNFIFYFYSQFVLGSYTFSSGLTLSGILLKYTAILLLFLVSVLCLGQIILRKFYPMHKYGDSLKIAVGLSLYFGMTFLIACFSVLNLWALGVMYILPILINYKGGIKFTKKYLVDPISEYEKVNYVGYGLFLLLILHFSLNYLSVLSPIPYGFDSRNFYMNVAQLLAENGEIIKGFQPYNWQLFISSGFVLFDSHEVAILLCISSLFLTIVALNDICSRTIKMSINYRLLLFSIVLVTPAYYNQVSVDVKVDFALLFFQLVVFHEFLKYLDLKNGLNIKHIAIIGLLSGVAMGIKFINLYLIFAVIVYYWLDQLKFSGFITAFLTVISVFLFAKIDDIAGLRASHLGVDYQQFIFFGLAIIFFTYLVLRNRNQVWRPLKFSIWYGLFLVLPILPWTAKNYYETKSLSPKTLLMGSEPGYKLSVSDIQSNYKKLSE